MTRKLVLRANAKINLSLKVLSRRPDGFHDIQSIMQSISLHDMITLVPSKSGISLKCDHPELPKGEDNLAYRAAKMFFDEINAKSGGVSITLQKNIPVAAGLGGGSADAAAVLTGLNMLNGSKLHKEKLEHIAARLGSDVPFCLTGGTAECSGRGELIRKVNPKNGNTFILAFPDVRVPTKTVYEGYDNINKKDGSAINDLEQVTLEAFPKVKEIKDRLVEATGIEWMMSGSGPVYFAEFRDLGEVDDVVGKIAKICSYHVAMRMNEGVSVVSS